MARVHAKSFPSHHYASSILDHLGLAVPAWTSPRPCLEETQDQAVEGEARRDLSAIENLWKLHIEHFKSEFLAVRLDGFVHESLAERFGGEVY